MNEKSSTKQYVMNRWPVRPPVAQWGVYLACGHSFYIAAKELEGYLGDDCLMECRVCGQASVKGERQ